MSFILSKYSLAILPLDGATLHYSYVVIEIDSLQCKEKIYMVMKRKKKKNVLLYCQKSLVYLICTHIVPSEKHNSKIYVKETVSLRIFLVI